MYTLQILTPPTQEPVSVAEMRTHLRLNTQDEDSVLASYISAARVAFEIQTCRSVLPTTWRQNLNRLCGPVVLMRGQATSIVQVQYYDTADTQQTLTNYKSDVTGIPARVWMPQGSNWPDLSVNIRPALSVDFVAGWPSVSAIPALVLQGIRLLAAHWFEQRAAFTEKTLAELPQGFTAICQQYETGLRGPWETSPYYVQGLTHFPEIQGYPFFGGYQW